MVLYWVLKQTRRFLTAVPTAELEPFTETYIQADEVRCNR